MVDIEKEIQENEIIVFMISSKDYNKKLGEIVKCMLKSRKKICYVSLNKSYETLINGFKLNDKDVEKFLWVQSIKTPKKNERVILITSPKALTELNITLNKVLDIGKIDCTVVDSLSTLLSYANATIIIRFAHSLISKMRIAQSTGIFTILKEDINESLSKNLNMFADSVVDLS